MMNLNDATLLVSGAFDVFPDAILVVDKSGVIKNTNKQVLNVFGYEELELKEQSLSILLPERSRDKHEMLVRGFFAESGIRKMGDGASLRGVHKKGHEIDIDIALSIIPIGEEIYALAVVRDLSEKLNMISQLNQAENIKNELERFAFILTHDLKAPLYRIKLLSQLIDQGIASQDGNEIHTLLNYLLQSVNGMEGLIHGVLGYFDAKLSPKKAKTKVNLNVTFAQSIAMINIPATFKVDLKTKLPVVKGDSTMMLQIFNNFIANSVIYNNKKKGLLEIDVQKQGKMYLFSFDDNGITVPDEHKLRIFNLTVRLNKKRDASHGLGLSIVQEIVNSNGGKIWCEDSHLGGCCFKFTWPF